MLKRLFSAILILLIMLSLPINVVAVDSELDVAVAFVTERKIFVGDDSGNLNLDKGLTRAELAVLLTRIRGDEDIVKADAEAYSSYCTFADVADWAAPYVGYCYTNGLMVGYENGLFGMDDVVLDKAACTVLLRHLTVAVDYDTAVATAVEAGLTPSAGLKVGAITRGDMAIMIYKAMTGAVRIEANGSGQLAPVPINYKVVSGDSKAREDFSQQANPAVFDDVYTRELYNAIRQTLLDKDKILPGNGENGTNPYYHYAWVNMSDATRSNIGTVLSKVQHRLWLDTGLEPFAKEVWKHPNQLYIRPVLTAPIAGVDALVADAMEECAMLESDADKVRLLNEYLCDRMSYDINADASIVKIFSSETKVKGQCSSFAVAFAYLCDLAGVPCITITGENHAWNMVYTNGKWLYVDASSNSFTPHYNHTLLSETYRKKDENPKATAFAKELIVPGSTR